MKAIVLVNDELKALKYIVNKEGRFFRLKIQMHEQRLN